MTSARHTTAAAGKAAHRRVLAARKPLIAGVAATAALVDAWYATAGAATGTAPNLSPTNTTVNLSAKFPYQSAGYNNAREWTRTATAVAPNGTCGWPGPPRTASTSPR